MANTKEIQKRMKSIQDTMKITSAMYMISSAKLRSAKQKLENTEPYFYALQSAISLSIIFIILAQTAGMCIDSPADFFLKFS